MDVVLIIMIIVVSLLLLYVNVYLLALYCHPEDGGFGASLILKIIVVLGLTLSWAQVLLLPVDVSNTRSDQGLDMYLAWTIIYYSVLGLTTVIIPLANFYYESDEDKPFVAHHLYIHKLSRMCMTLFQEFIVLLFVGLTILLTFMYLNESKLPVRIAVQSVAQLTASDSIMLDPTLTQDNQDTELAFQVSLVTFIMGLMCFVGYIFLLIFGGVGLTALPLDLIKSFRTRPVFRSSTEAATKKKLLKAQSEELIKIAQRIKEDEKDAHLERTGWFGKGKKNSKIDRALMLLEQRVDELREEYEIFKLELTIEASNPLVFMMKLCLGVLLLCVTILWWVHMYQYLHKNSILFIIVRKNGFPYHPFLNKMFTELEAYNVNFIGVFFFGFFTLYLLWCVTKGNIKVGLRIPFLFTMHPMKLNGTWMNSFLFNIVLILYSSVAVTHFSTTCFSQYLRHTTIAHLFGIQVRYLTMLSWALDNRVFEFALFGWSLLAAMVQCGLSMSAPGVLAEIEAKRQAQKKKNNNVEIELKEYLIQK